MHCLHELSPESGAIFWNTLMQSCGAGELQTHLPVSQVEVTPLDGLQSLKSPCCFPVKASPALGLQFAHPCTILLSCPKITPLVPFFTGALKQNEKGHLPHSLPATLMDEAGAFPFCLRSLSTLPAQNKLDN